MGVRLYRGAERHVALAVAVLVLAVMGWTLYRDMQQTRIATRGVMHAAEVLRTIGSVRENLARMESATRGYLLTRSTVFLEQRDRAVTLLNASLGQLEFATADDRSQNARLQELVELSRRRTKSSLDTLDAGSGTAELLAANELTLKVYALTAAMEEEELRRLASRQGEYQRQQERDIAILFAVVLAGILLLVPAYVDAARQKRLRVRAEQQMADLVENLPVTAWQMKTLSDGSRQLVYVAPGAHGAKGVAAEAMRNEAGVTLDRVVPEDRQRLREAMERAERTLQPLDETYRILSEAAGIRWVRGRATLRRMPDGAILWSGYWQDVTHQKRIEQELRDANGELEAFSYSVSHDLRAPLGAIEGFSQALRERAGHALDERSSHFVSRIQAATRQMTDLIDGLLQLAQVNRHSLQADAVDLSRIAGEVVATLREAEPGRRVQVEIEPGLRARGDHRLLRLVMTNLLSNAWKFTRRREQARIIVGQGAAGSGEAAFFVKDNGAGFDMAYADKLFGAFQRLHTAAEFPGTGIGLATVMRIVCRHGGRAWAESSPGEGATFYFTLPAAAQPAHGPQARPVAAIP